MVLVGEGEVTKPPGEENTDEDEDDGEDEALCLPFGMRQSPPPLTVGDEERSDKISPFSRDFRLETDGDCCFFVNTADPLFIITCKQIIVQLYNI